MSSQENLKGTKITKAPLRLRLLVASSLILFAIILTATILLMMIHRGPLQP